MHHSIVVVIPIYKELPNKYEVISLKRCCKVFQKRDVCFVTFEGLDTNFYRDIVLSYGLEFNVQKFDDHYFRNIAGYNSLCMSKDFYCRFLPYEYMLIYQLDAYVFSDQLDSFCDIGIPYLGGYIYDSISRGFYNEVFLKTGFKVDSSVVFMNGGLSLRKIELFCSTVQSSVFQMFKGKGVNEDGVFSVLLCDSNITKELVLSFSFDAFPDKCFEMSKHKLPMGCHAWWKGGEIYNYLFWQKRIMPLTYIRRIVKKIMFQ